MIPRDPQIGHRQLHFIAKLKFLFDYLHMFRSFLVCGQEKQFWINAQDKMTLLEWMVRLTASFLMIGICCHFCAFVV